MSSDPIKAVLFNIDETLFDHQHSVRAGIQAVHASCPRLLAKDLDKLVRSYRRTIDRLAREGCTKKGARTGWDRFHADTFLKTAQKGEWAPFRESTFKRRFMKSFMDNRRPMPNVSLAFKWLKINGYKIGIVTTERRRVQEQLLRSLGLLNDVDVMVTAAEVKHAGMDEPDSYERATNMLGLRPWEVVMVGSCGPLTEGALRALCKAIYYNPYSSLTSYTVEGKTGVRVLSDLKDLPEILQDPDLINWRLSIEEDVNSCEHRQVRSSLPTPEWSPLSPAPAENQSTSFDWGAVGQEVRLTRVNGKGAQDLGQHVVGRRQGWTCVRRATPQ